LGGDAPACAQDVAGDCQFVGGCANILRGVVEDEIFEMDEFAVDPEGRAGIGEVGALDPPLADRRAGDALIQTRERNASIESRSDQGRHADFRNIISHCFYGKRFAKGNLYRHCGSPLDMMHQRTAGHQ
jgi:hypothetical protein